MKTHVVGYLNQPFSKSLCGEPFDKGNWCTIPEGSNCHRCIEISNKIKDAISVAIENDKKVNR